MGSGIVALAILFGVIVAVFTVQGKSEARDSVLQRIRNEEAEKIKKAFYAKFGHKHGEVKFIGV